MLSFNKLGKSGRLGNQMFQYAALRGIAANRGFDWVVPPPGTSGVDEFGCENNYCMFETFKMTGATESIMVFLIMCPGLFGKSFTLTNNFLMSVLMV